MELKGKMICGIIGIFVGDLMGLPFGAFFGFIAGSVLGHYLFDHPREQEQADGELRAFQRKQGAFLFHVFSLCAKMAKADGAVSTNEINLMERLMRQQFRLNDRGRAQAIKIWKQAKESTEPFESYARAFYDEFGKERYQVMNMMDLLFAMAAADGGLPPRKEELLLRAAGIFHIGRLQYERIKSRYYHIPPSTTGRWSPLDPYYALLGAKPQDSLDAIKQKFRALAKQWHPDVVSARGASVEAQRHAKEKFQKINEAYEKIIEARKA